RRRRGLRPPRRAGLPPGQRILLPQSRHDLGRRKNQNVIVEAQQCCAPSRHDFTNEPPHTKILFFPRAASNLSLPRQCQFHLSPPSSRHRLETSPTGLCISAESGWCRSV